MKYLFCVFGTPNGDLGPAVIISRELIRRGHSVTIASHESYRDLVAEQGIRFIGTLPAMTLDEVSLWWEKSGRSNVKEWGHLAHLQTFHAESNITRLLKDADFDTILCIRGDFIVPIVAEKLGVPWGTIISQPIAFEFTHSIIFFRTSRLVSLRRIALPKFFSKTLYLLSLLVLNHWMYPLKSIRKALDLPPPTSRYLSIGKSPLSSPHFNIALYSPVFSRLKEQQLKEEYPQPIYCAGFVQEQSNFKPITKRMSQFLEKGDPPLLFSFGTFVATTTLANRFVHTAVKTCILSKRRAIFIVGRSQELLKAQLGEQFIVGEYEPFPSLMPKVSLVVHIGGMGTIIAALQAGVPQLILPFSYEQCDNALRLQELGLSRTLTFAHCNVSNLIREIESTSANNYRERATEVSSLIEHEDGATKVADYLENLHRVDPATTDRSRPR